MFQAGYWVLGRWRGVPIKLHFTIVLGALVFCEFRWDPGFFLAYPCLILIHELGHAAFVRRLGHRVAAVEVTGFGGVCRWSGHATDSEEALIAWGGVVAQLLVFAVATLWLRHFLPTSAFGWQVAMTLTHTNLWLVVLNLLPIPPLDGARAWGIFGALRDRRSSNLPRENWRDRAADAEGAWFDKLRPRAKRPGASEVDIEAEGPLNSDAQQAIDRLLKSVTGKARNTEHDD